VADGAGQGGESALDPSVEGAGVRSAARGPW
jgi:hypothetical protein